MEKEIYIVRHCKAEGQPPESQLTDEGFIQANQLVDFFSDVEIDRIISSPFTRATQSIQPLAKSRDLTIYEDNRLAERKLSDEPQENWLEFLEESFVNLDINMVGGETGREAMNRGTAVINNILKTNLNRTVIVTHGNLMTLLLKHYDSQFGFNEWKTLSNPDVYLLKVNDYGGKVKRLWED